MGNSAGEIVAGDMNMPSNSGDAYFMINRRFVRITSLFLGVVVISYLILYKSAYPFQFLPSSLRFNYGSPVSTTNDASTERFDYELERVLKDASMGDKTVILTTLNDAWAEPDSIFDVFLDSFKIGNKTQKLVSHLVIISMDQKAHSRCLAIHPHCYALKTQGINFSTEAYFMTPDYLEMMWRRIKFLATVLEMGYSFVFTDADIVWLRDPFPRFYRDADFQIACDNYIGNSYNRGNRPNGGFTYVKSNLRSILFYKYWYSSRKTYPGLHDQDVLNRIKYDPFVGKIGLKIRFLDTAYFGGFCEPSQDFNLVCTMHANCCFGLESKVHDLKILLQDWARFMSSSPTMKASSSSWRWNAPQNCSLSYHPPDLPKKTQQGDKK